VPALIGRMHDGTAIKGGPYTLTQAFVIPLTAWLAWMPHGLWGTGEWIADGLLALGIAAGVGWAVGRMPDDRNPLLWVAGVVSVLIQPRWGRANGRPITVPKPCRVRGPVVVQCRELHRLQAAARPEAGTTAASRQPATLIEIPALTEAVALAEGTALSHEDLPRHTAVVRHTGVEALLASINRREQR
jgi:hypothetical protein